MEEVGVVKSIEGNTAKVLVARKSICGQCKAGTCHMAEDGAEMEAVNAVGAKVGQRVRVSLEQNSYLKNVLMVYGLPMIALIGGAVLGKEVFAPMFEAMDPDIVSAMFGFGALLLSIVFVKLWSKGMEKKTGFKPVIEEILD
jgi:sigma-E factor negative regulatory protein RseC